MKEFSFSHAGTIETFANDKMEQRSSHSARETIPITQPPSPSRIYQSPVSVPHA